MLHSHVCHTPDFGHTTFKLLAMGLPHCVYVHDHREPGHHEQTVSNIQLCTLGGGKFFSIHFSLSGHVAGQLTAAPPTCPDDTFTFSCTVTGDISGITIWRVNGSSNLCFLVHISTSSSTCGPGNAFIAISGTGYGTSASSFSSTLSGTATSALDDTLVECFGPAGNLDPQNRVGSNTLQIIGLCVFDCQ